MRMNQLFELMVAWARDAPEDELMPPTTQGTRECTLTFFVFLIAKPREAYTALLRARLVTFVKCQASYWCLLGGETGLYV